MFSALSHASCRHIYLRYCKTPLIFDSPIVGKYPASFNFNEDLIMNCISSTYSISGSNNDAKMVSFLYMYFETKSNKFLEKSDSCQRRFALNFRVLLKQESINFITLRCRTIPAVTFRFHCVELLYALRYFVTNIY